MFGVYKIHECLLLSTYSVYLARRLTGVACNHLDSAKSRLFCVLSITYVIVIDKATRNFYSHAEAQGGPLKEAESTSDQHLVVAVNGSNVSL